MVDLLRTASLNSENEIELDSVGNAGMKYANFRIGRDRELAKSEGDD